MSRRHTDYWRHPGHYLVDPYTWPWSPNGHVHDNDGLLPPSLCNVNRPSNTEIQLFQNLTMVKVMCVAKVKVTFDLQNSKVKVMMKVKPIGHIWGLEFNRYVCFSFRGNRTIFGWDTYMYRKFYMWPLNSRSSHGQGQIWWPHLRPWSSIYMFAFRFVAIGPFLAEI